MKSSRSDYNQLAQLVSEMNLGGASGGMQTIPVILVQQPGGAVGATEGDDEDPFDSDGDGGEDAMSIIQKAITDLQSLASDIESGMSPDEAAEQLKCIADCLTCDSEGGYEDDDDMEDESDDPFAGLNSSDNEGDDEEDDENDYFGGDDTDDTDDEEEEEDSDASGSSAPPFQKKSGGDKPAFGGQKKPNPFSR